VEICFSGVKSNAVERVSNSYHWRRRICIRTVRLARPDYRSDPRPDYDPPSSTLRYSIFGRVQNPVFDGIFTKSWIGQEFVKEYVKLRRLEELRDVFDYEHFWSDLSHGPQVLAPQVVQTDARVNVAIPAEWAEALAWRSADDNVSLGERSNLLDWPSMDMRAEVPGIGSRGCRVNLNRKHGIKPDRQKARSHPARTRE